MIKTRYRQLALRYHPDRNDSPEAARLIIEVNEAYEVLGDLAKRSQYDLLRAGYHAAATPKPQAPRHRDPRYRPKSAEYIRVVRENSINTYMRSNLRYMVLISRLTLGFASFCLLDYALPAQKQTHQIVSTHKTTDGHKVISSFILHFENQAELSLASGVGDFFADGDTVDYYASLILSVPVKIENQRNHYLTRVRLSYFGNFLFFPIILLVSSALGVFYKGETVEFRFNVGLFNLIFLLFNLFFLTVNKP